MTETPTPESQREDRYPTLEEVVAAWPHVDWWVHGNETGLHHRMGGMLHHRDEVSGGTRIDDVSDGELHIRIAMRWTRVTDEAGPARAIAAALSELTKTRRRLKVVFSLYVGDD